MFGCAADTAVQDESGRVGAENTETKESVGEREGGVNDVQVHPIRHTDREANTQVSCVN